MRVCVISCSDGRRDSIYNSSQKLYSGFQSSKVHMVLSNPSEQDHYIPAKRISDKYLINLHYGFGAMTPQLTLVATNCSSLQLLLISLLRIPKRMIQLAFIGVSALMGKSRWIELILMFSYFRGEVSTLVTILGLRR